MKGRLKDTDLQTAHKLLSHDRVVAWMIKVHINKIKDLRPAHQILNDDSLSDQVVAWNIEVHVNKIKDLLAANKYPVMIQKRHQAGA